MTGSSPRLVECFSRDYLTLKRKVQSGHCPLFTVSFWLVAAQVISFQFNRLGASPERDRVGDGMYIQLVLANLIWLLNNTPFGHKIVTPYNTYS